MFNHKFCIIIVLCIAAIFHQSIPPWKRLPTVEELASRHGYGVEKHYITTPDGIVLEHHRIVNKANTTMPGTVVILNHGLMASSSMWILSTPGRSLGFYLAERGFDVWLLNIRGNGEARTIGSFSESGVNYWNYSLHEIAVYDLPASIDYILDLTDAKKADFVGYSMGATIYFAMASELPQYTKKLERVVAIAPAVFNTDIPAMTPYTYYVSTLILTGYSYAYAAGLVSEYRIKGTYCITDTFVDRSICAAIRFLTSKIPDGNINTEEYGEIIGSVLGSTSSLMFLHYYQNKISGRFAKFDYGASVNSKLYGQPQPPDYNLTKSENPVAVFWSHGDLVTPWKGVQKLISSLPNVVLNDKIALKGFGHAAFAAARDAESIVNEKLCKFLASEVVSVFT